MDQRVDRLRRSYLPRASVQVGCARRSGRPGGEQQQAQLGDLPDYEQGLFQLAGGARPLVTDFSTFSPFAAPADVAQAVARPGELAGFLNPVVGSASGLVHVLNQYGGKSKSPIGGGLSYR